MMKLLEMKNVNNELFKDYFKHESPIKMHKVPNETKNLDRNKDQLNIIKSALADLRKDTENTSKDDVNEIKEKNEITSIVERILYSHDKRQDEQRQGLKILTPSQIPSTLPISLAQLKAENNSENVKNEIR